MSEQIHWAAKRGTKDAIKMLSNKAGFKGNMSVFLTMLLFEYIEKQPPEVQGRKTIIKVKESYAKKKSKV